MTINRSTTKSFHLHNSLIQLFGNILWTRYSHGYYQIYVCKLILTYANSQIAEENCLKCYI